MRSFWNRINNQYNLDFGDNHLSPILKASIGITLDYINKLKDNGVERPLCLCFPERFESAIWISLAILRNAFLNDYIFQTPNRIEELELRRSDMVEIFECTARYLSHDRQSIRLAFRDIDNYSTSIKINTHINRSNHSKLNKLELFQKNRRKFRENRNAISKILEPKEGVLINSGLLKSKVLLVTGRGNLSKTKERLAKNHLHGESLDEIFKLGETLLLTPDLDPYKNCFKNKGDEQFDFFKALFIEMYSREWQAIDKMGLGNKLNELKNLYDRNEVLSIEFRDLLEELIENIEETELPFIRAVLAKYPDHDENLPANLQAVVLNDVTILETYPETIAGFLKNRIPVIIICDRLITLESDTNFYAKTFERFPETIRINWSRNKINALMEFETERNYLDELLWSKCKRFSLQKISIEKFGHHPLDTCIPSLQKMLFGLDGFEKLKAAYWKWLYPAYCVVKNDFNPSKKILDTLVKNFVSDTSQVTSIAPADVQQALDLSIKEIINPAVNSKTLNDSGAKVFCQQICSLDGTVLVIPSGITGSAQISDVENSIVFTGYPFSEPLNSVLIKAISANYVPEIKVLAWPEEANSTYRYIYKRLRAGYYIDHDVEGFGVPKYLLLLDENQIEHEITEIIGVGNHAATEESAQEDFLVSLTRSILGAYQASQHGDATFSVKCNVIHFEQQEFMFLPYKSKVLTEIETNGNIVKVKRCLFNELKIGSKIFTYKLNRQDRRRILRQYLSTDQTLDDLYLWKVALEAMYEATGKDLGNLEQRLIHVKEVNGLPGNPSRYNLSRWLFDEDLLSPDIENVAIILKGFTDSKIEQSLKKIKEAYRIVTSLNIQISSQLKKQLTSSLNSLSSYNSNRFAIEVSEVEIEIECRKIAALQKDHFEVDYVNTRKILS